MRITIVCPQFFPSVGGIQIDVQNLAKRLAAGGDDVTVMTSNLVGRSAQSLPSDESIDGINVRRFAAVPTPGFPYVTLTPAVVGALGESDPDVVHVLSYLPTFLTNAALIEARQRRRPLVVTPVYHPNRARIYHNVIGRLVDAAFDRRAGLKLLAMADRIIAQTDAEAAFYRAHGLDRVVKVPIGVDLEEHQCTPERAQAFAERYGVSGQPILFLGRIEPRKGLPVLLRALPRLLGEAPDATLLLVGDRLDDHPAEARLARDLGIEGRIVSAGRVPFEDIPAAFEVARLVAIPSVFEVTSRVVLEAWAHRKPVVATRGIGYAEIVEPGRGVIVDHGDAEALGDGLVRLFHHPEEAAALGEAGYRHLAEGYLWDDVTAVTRAIYEEVTAHHSVAAEALAL